MTQLMYTHISRWIKSYKNKQTKVYFGFIRLPSYLENWQDTAGFCLMCSLIFMLGLEPILHCMSSKEAEDKLFYEECEEAEKMQFAYSIFSMFAMFLYYA